MDLALLAVITHVVSDLVHGVKSKTQSQPGVGIVRWSHDDGGAVRGLSHIGTVDNGSGSAAGAAGTARWSRR